jgi:hypothetical protein
MTPRPRKSMTTIDSADTARLRELVRGIPRERLALALTATERITFNVTPVDKEEIRATAEALGLSMTDYLLRLHALISERLREEGRRK